MKRLLSAAFVVVLSSIVLPGQQLIRGTYLVGTMGWNTATQPVTAMNTVQMVNPYTGKVTPLKLTIPNGEFASSFLINSPTSFFMGTKLATKGTPVQGNVYLVTLQTNGTWLATRLNVRGGTNGRGGLGINVSSMVSNGTFIFVCGSAVFAPTATDAQVHRILLANGQVFPHSRFGAAFMAGGALGSSQAMALIGNTLHVFTFDSQFVSATTGVNQHWSVSTNQLAPAPTLLGNLPPTNRSIPARGFASTEALVDPRSGNIIVVSRWGELLWRTPAGVNVNRRQWPGMPTTTNQMDQFWNACAINTDTWELALGDFNGASIDVFRDNGPLPTVNNLVKANQPTPGIFTVSGLTYFPTPRPSVYHPIGTGCKESSGLGPWSYVNSPPTPGNATFALTLSTTNRVAALAIGTRLAAPINFGPLAPGCLWYVNPLVFVAGAPAYAPTLRVPLPPNSAAVTVFTQWVVLDPRANPLGIAVSAPRMIRP